MQVQMALQGIKREGRTPADLKALLDECLGQITLDDIKKELVLRELPQSLRQQLVELPNDISCKES